MSTRPFLDTYGYTREEIIGKKPSLIWSPNNHDGLIQDILAISRTGGWRGEVLNITKNGREFLVSLSTSQVRDKDGTIIALAGISKDVTEQKHAEERLQVSEERQRFILDSMPVAIYSSPLDPEIDTAWIGGDVKKVTGYTVEEYLSEPDFWRSRLHPDDVETVRNTYRSITLDHEAILEYRWKCRDGEYHWFQERTTLKQKKEQKEFLGIIIDITERKEMVRALQENESRYRSIVENLHQAYYEADSRAVFTYCNPELYLMTGFTEKDLIGSSALRLVAPEDRPVISEAYHSWKEEKREFSSIEFMAQMKNGDKYLDGADDAL
jgi:PAS domain S-box-containing protein